MRIAAADKIAFVDRLSEAGHGVIEVSAFVSPKWVPQMAGTAIVFEGISRHPDIRYTALVPNIQGLDRAMVVGTPDERDQGWMSALLQDAYALT